MGTMGRRNISVCDGCGREQEEKRDEDRELVEGDGWLCLGFEYGELLACRDCVGAIARAVPGLGAAIERGVAKDAEQRARRRRRRDLLSGG